MTRRATFSDDKTSLGFWKSRRGAMTQFLLFVVVLVSLKLTARKQIIKKSRVNLDLLSDKRPPFGKKLA